MKHTSFGSGHFRNFIWVNRRILLLLFVISLNACAPSKNQVVSSRNSAILLEEKKEFPDKVYMTIPQDEINRLKDDASRLAFLAEDLTYQFCYLIGIVSDQGRLPNQPSWPKVKEMFEKDLDYLLSNKAGNGSGSSAIYTVQLKTIRHYVNASIMNMMSLPPDQALDTQLDTALQGLLNFCKMDR